MFKTLITAAALTLAALSADAAVTLQPLAPAPATSQTAEADQTAYFCQWVTVYDYYGNWVTVWRCF